MLLKFRYAAEMKMNDGFCPASMRDSDHQQVFKQTKGRAGRYMGYIVFIVFQAMFVIPYRPTVILYRIYYPLYRLPFIHRMFPPDGELVHLDIGVIKSPIIIEYMLGPTHDAACDSVKGGNKQNFHFC